MILSIIAAVGKNNVIGSKNGLPWRLPSDLKRFKEITMGHPVIMGRKTFESIGRPLPGRKNIVVTRNPNFPPPEIYIASSLGEAVNMASDGGENEAFIIGGDSIFKEGIDIANKLLITYVDSDVDGDTYFPNINKEEWQEVSREEGNKTDKDEYQFSYVTYQRK